MKKKSQVARRVSYWLILGLANSLRVLTWLPLALQMKLGEKLGQLLLKHASRMRRVAKKNIELCFPTLNEQQQQQFLQNNFQNVGIGVFECLNSAWAGKKTLLNMIESIEGEERLQQVIQQGHSAVLLFPHMIPMYLAGHLLGLKTNIPQALMYHSPKNKAINDFIYGKLKPHTDAVFTRKDSRRMINYLKQGKKCVWFAPDLDLGKKQSEFSLFFGLKAATLTSPTRIAELTGAKFLPIGFYRVGIGQYKIKIYPALDPFPSGDLHADLKQINTAVETIINEAPQQYLWVYKRFGTRPEGEERWY